MRPTFTDWMPGLQTEFFYAMETIWPVVALAIGLLLAGFALTIFADWIRAWLGWDDDDF